MKMGRHGKRTSTFTGADAPGRPSRSAAAAIAGSGTPQQQPDAGCRRNVGWLRPRCRWAAARIRIATGVKSPGPGRERLADHGTPWLGLLLWAIACVGLLVSLLTQNANLDREPRLAAREIAALQHAGAHRPSIRAGRTIGPRLLASEHSLPR